MQADASRMDRSQAIRDRRQRAETTLPRGPVRPVDEPVRVRLHHHHHQTRHRSRPSSISRHWIITDAEQQGAGSARPRRGRAAAVAQAGRELRVHERHSTRHAGGHDARHLPDGRPRTARVRSAASRLSRCRCRACCISAARRSPAPASARRGLLSRRVVARRAAHRPPDDDAGHQEHHQRFEQEPFHGEASPFAHRVAVHPRRAARAGGRRCVLAGCAVTPPTPPTPPTPAPPSRPAKYRQVGFEASPDGARMQCAPRGQPSWSAAAALAADAARRAAWQAPCTAAEALEPRDDQAVRAFFERHFSPYQVTAPDGRDTGPGHRLLRAAASRQPRPARRDSRAAVRAARRSPDHRSRRAPSRAQGQAPARPRGRSARGAVLGPRRHRAGLAPVAGKELVYVDDPVEAFFLRDPGSGRMQLEDGRVVRLGYADQNGHPYRAIGRVLVERGDLEIERSVHAGHPRMGRAQPRQAAGPARPESELRVFPRGARLCAGFAGGGDRRPHRQPGCAAARPSAATAVDPRAIPLGAPIFLATTFPSTERPLQRLVIAQDTGGAIRGAVRADYFWGFGGDAGREAGRMRQEGRMWLLWPKDAPLPRGTPAADTAKAGMRLKRGAARPRPAGRRGRTSAPARRRRRAGSPAVGLALEHRERVRVDVALHRQVSGASAAGTGRSSACRCRVRACRACVARISSSVSPSPTIRPDLVGTSGKRRLEAAQQLQRMRVVGPGRACRYSRGTVSRLWFITSGGASARTPSARPGGRGNPAPAPRCGCPASARARRRCSRRNAERRRRAGRRDRRW